MYLHTSIHTYIYNALTYIHSYNALTFIYIYIINYSQNLKNCHKLHLLVGSVHISKPRLNKPRRLVFYNQCHEGGNIR